MPIARAPGHPTGSTGSLGRVVSRNGTDRHTLHTQHWIEVWQLVETAVDYWKY